MFLVSAYKLQICGGARSSSSAKRDLTYIGEESTRCLKILYLALLQKDYMIKCCSMGTLCR